MPILTESFVYLHVPKVGGSFTEEVFERLSYHGVFRDFRQNKGSQHSLCPWPADVVGDRTVLVGTRHPLSWLRSYWMHMKRSPHADFSPMPFARELRAAAFESTRGFAQFVDRVACDDIKISRIFGAYQTAYHGNRRLLVARESIVSHLCLAFGELGILPHCDGPRVLPSKDERTRELQQSIVDIMMMVEPSRGQMATNAPTVHGTKLAKRLRAFDPEAFRPFYS